MYASMTNPGLVFNLPKLLFRYAQMVKLGDLLPLVASACGSVNGKVERRRRDAGTQPEQNDRRRAAGGSTPTFGMIQMPLVTSAGFAKRNGHGQRRKGPTESPCSEAKNVLVTADWRRGGIRPRLYGSLVMFMQRK